jgi:hypothetical protein
MATMDNEMDTPLQGSQRYRSMTVATIATFATLADTPCMNSKRQILYRCARELNDNFF